MEKSQERIYYNASISFMDKHLKVLIIKHFQNLIAGNILTYASLKRSSTMDAYKGDEAEKKDQEELQNETPEFDRSLEYIGTQVDDVISKYGHMTEIMLSRKAYIAVRDMNTNPELYHIIERADHTESDQRHHLKIPDGMIAIARHTLNDIIRKMTVSMKKGRCQYGEITKKNLIHCMSKLHG